jgi:hypothetical protein
MAEPKKVTGAEVKKAEAEAQQIKEAFKTTTLAEIDAKLAELADVGVHYTLVEGNGNGVEKKGNKCGNCGDAGHSARTCPKPKK